MRLLLFILLIGSGPSLWGQSSSGSSNSSPANSQAPASTSPTDQSVKPRTPNLAPPRSDSVNVNSLGHDDGESSSKDTMVDLTPPEDDAKAHPQSADKLMDEGSGATDTTGFRYWDPHKAAKDVEVGDFYFKKKNYRAAEDRYREALKYKNNDAIATFRLAVCLEKLERPDDAAKEYGSYLEILPHGPEAEEAHKSIERLKAADAARARK
jgi:tetratricopeptide (TPR) repeat protein